MGTKFDRLVSDGGTFRATTTVQRGLFTLLRDVDCQVIGTPRAWKKRMIGKFPTWVYSFGSIRTSEILYGPWRHPSDVPLGDGLTASLTEDVLGVADRAWIDPDSSGPTKPLRATSSETASDVFLLRSGDWSVSLTLTTEVPEPR